MVYKHFRVISLIRIAFITLTILLIVYLIRETELYATSVILCLVAVYQIWAFLHYLEKSNRDLQRFLLSIRHSDFSQSFSSAGRGGSYRELEDAFDEVIEHFQATRSLAEERLHYLQTIVQHVNVGLIAYRSDGRIDLANPAAKRLLGAGAMHDLDSLAAAFPNLVEAFESLTPGRKKLLKLQRDDETRQLSLEATKFKQRDQLITLVSMQDVTSELAEREMEAWQKLVRVLTHEIMNSVTPIASLAGTVDEMIAQGPDAREVDEIRNAARTIQRRSTGLVQFMESYRSLTRIPAPNFQIVPVADLFQRVIQLAGSRDDVRAIQFGCEVEPQQLEVTADPNLIEQVLINLINNAIRALRDHENAQIALSGTLNDRGRVVLQVTDNGPGIDTDVLEKIFIPFFTTKPDGSGIGLSLSRQIMRMHKGDLNVMSEPNKRTVFTMRF